MNSCKKLREDVNNQELINAKKDNTRPSNEYYGLNWGYRSDNTVSSFEGLFMLVIDRKVNGHWRSPVL